MLMWMLIAGAYVLVPLCFFGAFLLYAKERRKLYRDLGLSRMPDLSGKELEVVRKSSSVYLEDTLGDRVVARRRNGRVVAEDEWVDANWPYDRGGPRYED